MSQSTQNMSEMKRQYSEISYSQSLVSTQIWPFVDRLGHNVFMMGYLYSLAKANLLGRKDELARQLIFIGEIMADDFGKVNSMSRAKAFDNLIEAVGYLMKDRDLNKYVDIDEEIWHKALIIENSVLRKYNPPKFETDCMQSFPWNANVGNSLVPRDAMMILYWLAIRAKLHSIKALVKAIITAYIAFCKRGSTTKIILKKLSHIVSSELHMQIEIDEYQVYIIDVVYGSLIDEKNAAVIFEKLKKMLPACATNIRSYLDHIPSRGLIYLKTISDALQMGPNFPWAEVEAIIPGELKAAFNAIVANDGNPYMFYNNNFRNVVMKRFQNLAYLCKEIMVQIFMKRSLDYYKGWTRTPRAKTVLDMLVYQYKQGLSYKKAYNFVIPHLLT